MKKRAYLYRLMVAVAILLVPLTICCLVLWQRSFTELKYNNQMYYESLLDNFSEIINEKIVDLKNHAANLIASSKEKNSVFRDVNMLLADSSYWYKEAVEEIKRQYCCESVSGWGMYLYSKDRIITTNGTMNSEEYLKLRLEVNNNHSTIKDWFSEENYEHQKELFASTNAEDAIKSKLLFGMMIKIGKNQEKALLIYEIEESDFKTFLDGIYGESGINFYVKEKNSSDIYLSLITDESAVSHFLNHGTNIGTDIFNSIYQIQDKAYPLAYVIQVTDDSFQNSIVSFHQDIKEILYLAMVLSLCICCVVLYFAYKPIYFLTEELEYEGENEFMIVRNALEYKKAKIAEQRMLIMDLLINNLVMGLPISEEKLGKLGIVKKEQFYCVMFLEGYVLSAREVEELIEIIEKEFYSKLFITDWQGEKKSILIVFMEENNCDSIVKRLDLWKADNLTENAQLRVGRVVDSLNDIKLSYISCSDEKEEQKKNDTRNNQRRQERQLKQREEIMQYIELHFCEEDLSQTQIADEFQISVYTLSRIFRNQIGIGFTDYVNGKRIEYSKELLLTTEDAVKDISLKVGFVNVNYFCKIFKNTIGVSPGDFRDNAKVL